MELRCHEFFGCGREGCPMFNEAEKRNCWEVDGTFNHCMNNNGNRISAKKKQDFCAKCLYFLYREKLKTA